jgi:hypothetical protein
MKKRLRLLAPVLLVLVLSPVCGQTSRDPVAEKYSASLAKIFALQARWGPIHPALAKVYPIAIV